MIDTKKKWRGNNNGKTQSYASSETNKFLKLWNSKAEKLHY